MFKKLLLLLSMFGILSLSAQDYFPKNDGVTSKNTNFTALINAKIYITPTYVVENGILLIQEGRVINVGQGIKLPENTVLIDLEGKSIYPSFVDIYSDFGTCLDTLDFFNNIGWLFLPLQSLKGCIIVAHLDGEPSKKFYSST